MKVNIQCPKCGGLLVRGYFFPKGVYYCEDCEERYIEAEVRERCAI